MLDALAQDMRMMRATFESLDQKADGITRSLPGIVAEVVREVLHKVGRSGSPDLKSDRPHVPLP